MEENKFYKKRVIVFSVIASILSIILFCLLISEHSYYNQPYFQISQRILQKETPFVTVETILYISYKGNYTEIGGLQDFVSKDKIFETLKKQEKQAIEMKKEMELAINMYDITAKAFINQSCESGGEKEKEECYQKLSDTSQN